LVIKGVGREAFTGLLQFLYSGQCSDSLDAQEMCEVLLLADRYQIQSAVDYCGAQLLLSVPQTRGTRRQGDYAILKVADVCRLASLRAATEEFVVKNRSLTLEMIRSVPLLGVATSLATDDDDDDVDGGKDDHDDDDDDGNGGGGGGKGVGRRHRRKKIKTSNNSSGSKSSSSSISDSSSGSNSVSSSTGSINVSSTATTTVTPAAAAAASLG
jgi:hypothetical protein